MSPLWLGLVTLVECFSRIIVRMASYNQTTQEIARPSELLVGVTAYTTSLQSLSSYISIDITRLVKSVLLQQTRPQDARGAQTITTIYTNWCACHILSFKPVSKYISCHCFPVICIILHSLCVCLSGSWRACCVKPATPSSSNALRCSALSTRAQTASQVSERRSFPMWQVRPRPYYSTLTSSHTTDSRFRSTFNEEELSVCYRSIDCQYILTLFERSCSHTVNRFLQESNFLKF